MKSPVFVKSPDVVSRTIAGEHLLVPVRQGVAQMNFLFTTNEVGGFVFELLDGRRGTDEIARCVSREFDVEEVRALADVAAFIEILRNEGLVRPAGEEIT